MISGVFGFFSSQGSNGHVAYAVIESGDPRADAVKIGGCVRCLAPGLLKVAEWWAPRRINMTRLWLSLGWPAMCGFMFWYHAHIMKVLGQPAAAKGGAAAGASSSFEGVTVGAEMNHFWSREWNDEYTRMIAGEGYSTARTNGILWVRARECSREFHAKAKLQRQSCKGKALSSRKAAGAAGRGGGSSRLTFFTHRRRR